MLRKINRQFSIFNFQFSFIWLLIIGLLVYSRFTHLGWGLPYPMHPDERNMANAVQQLSCKFSISNFQFSNCFNPRFFAYGQFSLYLGYMTVFVLKFFDGDLGTPIGFQEAIVSLRIISAVVSIFNALVLVRIIEFIFKKNAIVQKLLILPIIIFSPFFIQFSHFGTTESLLMFFYSLIIYFSLQLMEHQTVSTIVRLGIVSGLAIATKVSSAIFLAVPAFAFTSNIKNLFNFIKYKNKSKLHIKFQRFLIFSFYFVFCTLFFAVVFSPHNLINFQNFISSMQYESSVALGKISVFYTRQFLNTYPISFQLLKIFPYVLGWPVFLLAGLGFLGLSWKSKKINLLRFAFFAYFIPGAFLYAKWSRFMTPVLPLMSIFSILFLLKLKNFLFNNDWINSKFRIQNLKVQVKSQKFFTFYFLISFLTFAFLLLTCITPGIAYLSIYRNPDVRFQASEWIYKNIPNNSYILSETANVVDIPISNGTLDQLNNYSVISFNFYDLDQSPELQYALKKYISKVDYIFIPSRRIFANYTCYENDKLQIANNSSITDDKCQTLKRKYPILNRYYEELFSGRLGFAKVAEFESFPEIKFKILNFKFQIKYPDEQAEETWTVFDHPVIRIYKKVK